MTNLKESTEKPIENWLRPLLSQLGVKLRPSPRQGHRCHSSRVEAPEEWSLYFYFVPEIQFQGKHFSLFLALLLAVGQPWNQTPNAY